MTMRQRTTVVGVFTDDRQAEEAIDELRRAGFRDDQIGVARRRADDELAEKETKREGTHAGTGALAGAFTGAGLGALAGFGVLAGVMPVIGPAIAGGTLAVILSNAVGGAAVIGLIGALIGAGIPEEEAQYYNQEFEAGRTIVTVKADGQADEVEAILRRHGAYDMHTDGRSTAEGATTGEIPAAGTTATHPIEGQQRIQVKEEELHARKQPVETGEVGVRKEVHTEHKTLEVPVRKEEVIVERETPTERLPAGSDIRSEEEIRVPVTEEQVTVEKTPVVKEEVTVGKQAVQDTEQVAGDVREEEIRVERKGNVDVRDRGKNPKKP